MIKIYTPSQWYSLFQCPSIIIDDDGMIYKDEDYYKSFRQAVGKIDYDQGKIFGEDYYRSFAQPIGSIQNDGAVTKIYGPDYHRTFAQPILYIRDNRIYAADEFYKIFPSEVAFIRGDSGGTTTSGGRTSDNADTERKKSDNEDASGSCLGWFVGIVVVVILIAAAFLMPYWILSGDQGADMMQMLIMGLGFGGLIAFFTAKDWEQMVIRTILFAILGIFALDVASAYKEGDLKTIDLVIAAFFGIILYGLTAAVPGVILGTILWFIKRPFIKKRKQNNKKG